MTLRYFVLALMVATSLPTARAHAEEVAAGAMPPILSVLGALPGAAPILATNDLDRVSLCMGYDAQLDAFAMHTVMRGYFDDGHIGTEGRSSARLGWPDGTTEHIDSDFLAGLTLRPTEDGSPIQLELATGLTSGFALVQNDRAYWAGLYAGPRIRIGCRLDDPMCFEATGSGRLDWRTDESSGPRPSLDLDVSIDLRVDVLSVGIRYSARMVHSAFGPQAEEHAMFVTVSLPF